MTDNGIGFDPTAATEGHGLRNMQARAEMLGGRLEIGSADQGGTKLEWQVPMKPPTD